MSAAKSDKDAIRAANPIERVIQRYGVELKPAGRKDGGPVLKGHCPFHADSTPSFTVYTAQGAFYCYGCDEHGDVFTFVMQMERVEFKRALEILSGSASPTPIKRPMPRPLPELELDDAHYAAMEAAAELYHTALVNPGRSHTKETQAAQTFLRSRGIVESTIHHWRIG
ncbi:MAG: CHC2 zinc finger domain-containing protein, partial [Chloroflexota bacterium]